jgi:antitoxin component of MazEF toxin-antitoxin module
MKNALFAVALIAAATLPAAYAEDGKAQAGASQQVSVPANKWLVTRAQKRQEAIDMLRSGIPNSGEAYQSQLAVISK